MNGLGRDRGGFALAGVILAMALLMAFALAAWTAARSQVVVGGEALDWVRARIAAESALRLTLEHATGPSPVAPGSVETDFRAGTLGDRAWIASLMRPGLEAHAVVARAELRSRDQWVPVARAVWWLSPAARVRSFRASLEVGDLLGSDLPPAATAAVDDALTEVVPHAACRGTGDLGDGPLPLGGYGPLAPSDWGEPPWGAPQALRLGLWDTDRLRSVVDHVVSGRAEPTSCPTCWTGLTVASPGTEVAGTGAGLLVGTGDLRMGEGASWHGMVLVAGDLVLDPSASIVGLTRVGGRVLLAESARVVASGCAAYRSLLEAPGIHRPLRVGPPSALGPISPG